MPRIERKIRTREANERVLTDWRGNNYTVGDTILYPVGGTSGSDMKLVEAVVTEIYEYNYEDWQGWSTGLKTQPIRETRYYMPEDGTPQARVGNFRRTNLKDLTKVTKV